MIFVSLCGKKTRKKMMFLSLFMVFLSPYQNNVEKPKMSFTPFQMCLNLVNKLMDSEQSTLFKRLTKEVTSKMDWVDDDGVVHPEKRDLSKKSLELILLDVRSRSNLSSCVAYPLTARQWLRVISFSFVSLCHNFLFKQ